MFNRKFSTYVWLAVIAVFLSVQIMAQDADDSASATSEMTGEVVPDDGTVTEEPVEPTVEEPEDIEQENDEPASVVEEEQETSAPAPRRVSTPRRRLRLLDVQGPEITDVRIPEYSVKKENSQILAEIDDPELQKTTEKDTSADSDVEVPKESEDKNTERESSFEKVIQAMDYSIRNLIAWGSLGALLILMIVLYRLRTGRKRRRVFRKIPSKRR